MPAPQAAASAAHPAGIASAPHAASDAAPFSSAVRRAVAQRSVSVSQRDLREVQESIWIWRAARPDDPLSENLRASHTTEQAVEVALLLADSAVRADFRRRVHDSPLIRLRGFDPARDAWPVAPEGTVAPATTATMHASFALYPAGTDALLLTLRNTGREPLYFGEESTLSRFRNGRWEVLPTDGAVNALLHCLQPGGAFRFEVRLHPRLFPVASGRYRVTKRVETGDSHYLLHAPFLVDPHVPFPRFGVAPPPATAR